MLGDHPVCFGHGVRSRIEKYGFEHLFKNVAENLKDSDILFGNLEAVLSDYGYDPRKIEKAELRGKGAYALGLAELGFTVMSFANNHAMQHGPETFQDTVENLERNKIFCLGLENNGETNVFSFRKSEIEIAMLAYSLRSEKYSGKATAYAIGNEKNILKDVADQKKHNRIVIVSLHWGEEYLNYPSPEQLILGHKIVDAGATLILGHHPHVLQGIEKYQGGYIVYSLGNFIFDKWDMNARQTMILDCMISNKGIESLDFIPVIINREFQPQIATESMANAIKRRMADYSELIEIEKFHHEEDRMSAYLDAARKSYFKFRLSSYLYFLKNIYKYQPHIIIQSLTRSISRRLGDSR
jgi:poly-gamma-glutamate synthesis protein (capsule biosynthesis protein)